MEKGMEKVQRTPSSVPYVLDVFIGKECELCRSARQSMFGDLWHATVSQEVRQDSNVRRFERRLFHALKVSMSRDKSHDPDIHMKMLYQEAVLERLVFQRFRDDWSLIGLFSLGIGPDVPSWIGNVTLVI